MVHASMNEPSQTASVSAAAPDTVALPFDAFFVKHRDRLYGAMCLVTRDRGEAEDIAQEAFVKMLERWQIEGRTPYDIAAELTNAFDQYCAPVAATQ